VADVGVGIPAGDATRKSFAAVGSSAGTVRGGGDEGSLARSAAPARRRSAVLLLSSLGLPSAMSSSDRRRAWAIRLFGFEQSCIVASVDL